MQGQIIKALAGFYYVESEGQVYQTRARGNFRKKGHTPYVGDWVDFSAEENSEGYILKIHERKNSLVRPPIVNIDQAVVIMSVKEPDFNSNLLDRFLVLLEHKGIHPIVYISKMDLLEDGGELDFYQETYGAIGYDFVTSKEELLPLLTGKVTVFMGQTGVGKSTLLSVITSAKPKIGAYHFTTIVPNLGMVRTQSGESFAVADLPGLIEGASQGVGLGTQFLRHIERTRVILHVIDMSASEGRDPYEDYLAINKELESYNLRLMERPQIIVANKMDMPESQENLKTFKEKLAANYDEFEELPAIFPISGLTKQGLATLLDATAELLDKTPEFPIYDESEMEEEAYYGFDEEEKAFEISRDDDATWVLSGEKLMKLFNMTNFDRDESVMKFARQLRGMGVDEALRARGAKDGDLVRIGKFEFEFVD